MKFDEWAVEVGCDAYQAGERLERFEIPQTTLVGGFYVDERTALAIHLPGGQVACLVADVATPVAVFANGTRLIHPERRPPPVARERDYEVSPW